MTYAFGILFVSDVPRQVHIVSLGRVTTGKAASRGLLRLYSTRLARKIAVLGHRQAVDAEPLTFLKKQDARSLVKRSLAEWIVEGVTIRYLYAAVKSVEAQRGSSVVVIRVPMLNAPTRPQSLDLAYPEPSRSSYGHPHEAFLRECRAVRTANLQVTAETV
jgi:hypothetical protein